jgi:hypothetical protein
MAKKKPESAPTNPAPANPAPAFNPFAAAAAKSAKPAAPNGKKKNDYILVEDAEVATAIDDFVAAHESEKQAKADKEVAAGVAEPHCRTEFLRMFAEAGRQPESSPKFRTPAGNTVTFVVQDRGERYEVSEEQLQTLSTLLGEEKTEQVLLRGTTFSFNNDILNKPGVMEALGAKIGSLVSEGVLTEHEATALLEAKPRTTIRKGTLADLAKLCGNNPDQMEAVLSALGSHCSSYIKP